MKSSLSFIGTLAIVTALTACGPVDDTEKVPEDVQPPAAEEDVSEARIIEVTARNWDFIPDVITAKKGERVTIKLIGESGTHGFSVGQLGINESISPGETKTIELPTDEAGTFNLRCSIPCGFGHGDMTGKVVITE